MAKGIDHFKCLVISGESKGSLDKRKPLESLGMDSGSLLDCRARPSETV